MLEIVPTKVTIKTPTYELIPMFRVRMFAFICVYRNKVLAASTIPGASSL